MLSKLVVLASCIFGDVWAAWLSSQPPVAVLLLKTDGHPHTQGRCSALCPRVHDSCYLTKTCCYHSGMFFWPPHNGVSLFFRLFAFAWSVVKFSIFSYVYLVILISLLWIAIFKKMATFEFTFFPFREFLYQFRVLIPCCSFVCSYLFQYLLSFVFCFMYLLPNRNFKF